jgi:hypothetical protein
MNPVERFGQASATRNVRSFRGLASLRQEARQCSLLHVTLLITFEQFTRLAACMHGTYAADSVNFSVLASQRS